MIPFIPLPLYFFLLIELIAVSVEDLRFKKIKNYWIIFNLILFVLLIFIYPSLYLLSWKTFLLPVIFLIVGFVLFLLNIMGGGDSKFLFSFFLLIPLPWQEVGLNYLLYSIIFIGSIILLRNMVKNFSLIKNAWYLGDYKNIFKCFGSKFSFAPVILISWVWLGWEKIIKEMISVSP